MKFGSRWVRFATIIVAFCLAGSSDNFQFARSHAENALNLLSGFDDQRIQNCYPVTDTESAAEMAKLLYRIKSINEKRLQQSSLQLDSDITPGDVVHVEGAIESIRQYPLPDDLSEYLEMDAFQEVIINHASGKPFSIFAPPLAGKIAKGDMVSADAILVQKSDTTTALAAKRLAWFPTNPEKQGWQMLSSVGFDLSLISDAASRNRRVLQAEDADAFYGLMAAAQKVSSVNGGERVDPVALLTRPTELFAQWISIDAAVVRVTRIAIDSESVRQQLGQDHYFQIDASGDLGKKVLRLERAEGETGPAIEMSGSYPVTLVSTKLPEFLDAEFRQRNSLVAMISHPVTVEGFFYRLWSYSNEFMTKEGGGKQVGPLIVAADWTSRLDPTLEEESGIAWFGYVLAALILGAVLGTFIWQRKNTREDAAIRERNRKPMTINIPDES
ncbi:hypothetical protein LOC67_05465 [Stieleria sp. JC731]|uniref:hypothetical protein n=1 Tax=Pirellulaceae TaxID=2691357 RepID=UPI001E55F23A|nr:hypothetical protein [Stieleria sp. JC731]MCC9600002.1 hypothetical protein [Stieleria sp. JC731]